MSHQTLEGWATKINDLADHTYVDCPSKTDKKERYFNCWGSHHGPDKRKICSGKGVWKIANCYRKPAFGKKDTAGIGVYAVNGVCHQSANCFLYSTNPTVTLNLHVRGYIASVAAYGAYGTLFIWNWLPFIYNPCHSKYSAADALATKLHNMYANVVKQSEPANINQVLVNEMAIITQHHVPDINTNAFADIHHDFLREKNGRINAGERGEQLAQSVNDLSKEFQKKLSESMSDEHYTQLTGMKPGETINIVDPQIAAETAKHL